MSVSQSIDEIIKIRRSIRSFTGDSPPKESIAEVIQAGISAPFAGLASTGKNGRRFYVISRNNPLLLQLALAVKKRAKVLSDQLKAQADSNPGLQSKSLGFLKRLEMTAEQGPLGIGSAPYYIVVAEKKGIPDVQHQSLSYCLENMWLKATALNLGFHLVSITCQMEQDPEFCHLLNLPLGEYRLDGCALGYPAQIPPQPERPSIQDVTVWYD